MLQYDIAGLKLGIAHDQNRRFRRLRSFESCCEYRPDIEIKFKSSGYLPTRNYIARVNDDILLNTEYFEDKTFVYFYLKETKRTEYMIEADSNWSDITIHCSEGAKNVENAFSTFLGNFIISNKIILCDGIVMHASSIAYRDMGIVFTAPSGTGKSTHAAMWEKFYNADIINDDCPAIKLSNGKAYICGTPWSGSKMKAANIIAPLSAVIVLEQAQSNSICRLNDEKAIPMLLPRLLLPYYNRALMDTALKNIDMIFKNVPTYLLKCRADRNAIDLVHQCVV